MDINLLWLFGKSPEIRQDKNPNINIASEIYSSDGQLLGKYFKENRKLVKYDEIAPILLKSLIATEDVRFYNHFGIDYIGTAGIIWNFIVKGEKRGASTITQQLVKNLFKTRSNYSKGLFGHIPVLNILIYKTKEWISAIKLEILYSKNEIITLYLNTVDFGSNSYGIYTASKTYFGVKPSELNTVQAALLVGMLKAPSFFNPIINRENALNRRNVVLGQLLKYHNIDSNEYSALIKLPIKLKFSVENNYDGNATYFRSAVADFLRTWCKKNDYDIYADGLKIYSTLDSRLQNYSEEAMKWHMKRLQNRFYEQWQLYNPEDLKKSFKNFSYIRKISKDNTYFKKLLKKYNNNPDSISYILNKPKRMKVFTWSGEKDTTFSFIDSLRYYQLFLQAGFISIDPNNGFVRSWVGGDNFNYFKFDHVFKSKRQPGSTFKAFVYTAAIDNGYAPCDNLTDQPVTIKYEEDGKTKFWSPHNADWTFSHSSMTLKHAFAKSVNTIAVQLTQKIGWDKVIEYAKKLGIKSELNNVPSICLGSSDVSLFELVNAYTCLVNGGYKIEPVLVTKIEDRNGKLIYIYKPKKEKVLSDETAFLMRQMLQAGLTEPGGTTQALWEYDLFRYKTDFGGKTGTSSDHSDGWFVGITPNLVGGSWVGADDRNIHFKSSEFGEGCKTALPTYGKFMEKVLKDPTMSYYRASFEKPKFKISKSYTCHTKYTSKDTILKSDTL